MSMIHASLCFQILLAILPVKAINVSTYISIYAFGIYVSALGYTESEKTSGLILRGL